MKIERDNTSAISGWPYWVPETLSAIKHRQPLRLQHGLAFPSLIIHIYIYIPNYIPTEENSKFRKSASCDMVSICRIVSSCSLKNCLRSSTARSDWTFLSLPSEVENLTSSFVTLIYINAPLTVVARLVICSTFDQFMKTHTKMRKYRNTAIKMCIVRKAASQIQSIKCKKCRMGANNNLCWEHHPLIFCHVLSQIPSGKWIQLTNLRSTKNSQDIHT